ncbi:MAG TPA: cysteine-rich CWC family protein [Ottowia sp.]|uniref:cysteine-rich CWC family protein n=1 Tax=Ottowia sp. TaxID=1898956 RepID=UPI002C1A4EEF|nr:cysteine-rich CWC family protein [Ottowia sp.]HMN22594.1 cysteine-rich CWC family protein [Ottowia sp.]
MTFPASPIDTARCPLCGAPNQCALAPAPGQPEAQAPCWCTGVEFDAGLLAQVPADARRLACICRACAERTP